jgi:hypothetical protein
MMESLRALNFPIICQLKFKILKPGMFIRNYFKSWTAQKNLPCLRKPAKNNSCKFVAQKIK